MTSKIRRGISGIIFFDAKGRREYLLLKRKKNWKGWEFLKGGLKKGESESKALKREIREEIGISNFKAKRTNIIHLFKYQKSYVKDNKEWQGAKNRVFLIQIHSKKIRIDHNEHSGFKWANRKSALKMLTWNDFRKVFRKLA